MKVHKELGSSLSATLSARGAMIIEQAGVLWDAAYHGHDLPLDGHALNKAANAAREILEAIESYRDATAPAPPRHVPGSKGPWPRPSSHRQAVGMRCDDTPDEAA